MPDLAGLDAFSDKLMKENPEQARQLLTMFFAKSTQEQLSKQAEASKEFENDWGRIKTVLPQKDEVENKQFEESLRKVYTSSKDTGQKVKSVIKTMAEKQSEYEKELKKLREENDALRKRPREDAAGAGEPDAKRARTTGGAATTYANSNGFTHLGISPDPKYAYLPSQQTPNATLDLSGPFGNYAQIMQQFQKAQQEYLKNTQNMQTMTANPAFVPQGMGVNPLATQQVQVRACSDYMAKKFGVSGVPTIIKQLADHVSRDELPVIASKFGMSQFHYKTKNGASITPDIKSNPPPLFGMEEDDDF